MKRLAIGLMVAGLTGGSALAADFSAPHLGFPQTTPVYNWTGIYLGLQGGYAWGDSTVDYSFNGLAPIFGGPTSYNFDTDPDGFIGGGHLGALYQWGAFVLGAEGDIEFNTMDGEENLAIFDAFGTNLGTATATVEYNWSASARGRVGFAFERFLIYGTGGWAYSDVDTFATVINPAGVVTTNGTDEGLSGWTAGGGVDALLGHNLSARVEYRYTDLGDTTFQTAPDDLLTVEHKFHAVRAGLSYHF